MSTDMDRDILKIITWILLVMAMVLGAYWLNADNTGFDLKWGALWKKDEPEPIFMGVVFSRSDKTNIQFSGVRIGMNVSDLKIPYTQKTSSIGNPYIEYRAQDGQLYQSRVVETNQGPQILDVRFKKMTGPMHYDALERKLAITFGRPLSVSCQKLIGERRTCSYTWHGGNGVRVVGTLTQHERGAWTIDVFALDAVAAGRIKRRAGEGPLNP
ncbi:MAG: hypothetical protein OQK24_09185 [Magnetovibrio sp.]|nr:hypothetical protein [Magnetovibrio sp.]